jgi:hypothetical protein
LAEREAQFGTTVEAAVVKSQDMDARSGVLRAKHVGDLAIGRGRNQG